MSALSSSSSSSAVRRSKRNKKRENTLQQQSSERPKRRKKSAASSSSSSSSSAVARRPKKSRKKSKKKDEKKNEADEVTEWTTADGEAEISLNVDDPASSSSSLPPKAEQLEFFCAVRLERDGDEEYLADMETVQRISAEWIERYGAEGTRRIVDTIKLEVFRHNDIAVVAIINYYYYYSVITLLLCSSIFLSVFTEQSYFFLQ